MKPRSVRYTASVVAVPHAVGQWTVRMELTDDGGAVVQTADIDVVTFPSREQAEAAGWQLVDAWVRRFTEATEGGTV